MRKRKNFRKRPKDDSKGLSVKVWNNKKDPKRVREILYPVRKEEDSDDPGPVAI